MKIPMNVKINQVIEAYNHDTGETEFLLAINNEWVKISKDQYNEIRGKK